MLAEKRKTDHLRRNLWCLASKERDALGPVAGISRVCSERAALLTTY